MLDTTPLRDAYRALLDAAVTVADADTDPGPAAPDGEWNADQILAHAAPGCATGSAARPTPCAR